MALSVLFVCLRCGPTGKQQAGLAYKNSSGHVISHIIYCFAEENGNCQFSWDAGRRQQWQSCPCTRYKRVDGSECKLYWFMLGTRWE